MKPDSTQQVKLAISAQASPYEDDPSSATAPTPKLGFVKKIASVLGNRRTRSAIVGLTVSMGIVSCPGSYFGNAIATDNLSAGLPMDSIPDAPIEINSARKSRTLIAQTFAPRSSQPSLANRTDSNSLQFSGEPAVQIEVAQPKTRTYTRPIAANQPYGTSGESDIDRDDRPNFGTGETTIAFAWPAAGKLTSRFGRRWGRMHKGIDIAGPTGSPISAAADGTITYAGWKTGYGNLVEIRHADGTTTRYGHNSRLSVSSGQSVRQGQQIAEMGNTGQSTGTHLHFEIRPGGGSAVNPIAHLPSNS